MENKQDQHQGAGDFVENQQKMLEKARNAVMSPQVLANVFSKLQVKYKKGHFHKTVQQAQADLESCAPVERVNRILAQGQFNNIKVAQLLWQRFDLRQLPALVWFEDQWQMAERHSHDQIQLTNASNEAQRVSESALYGTLVIWFKVIKDRAEVQKEKGNLASKMVWRALFNEPGWLANIAIATILINLLAVATSLFAMQVYDRVVPTLAYATLTTLIVGMAIVVVLDWLLKIIRARILDSVASEVDKRITQDVFDHVMHLQLDKQPRSLGTLSAQISGLDSVRNFFSSGIVFGLVDLPFVLMFIGFISIIGGVVAYVYILLLPVALLLGLYAQWKLRKLLKEQLMRTNERQGLLVDSIQGAESIRASNATWRFSEEWQDITGTISSYNLQNKAITNFTTTSTTSLSTAAYVSAIAVGVVQIELGNLTMGGLIACTILGGRVIGPVAQGVRQLTQWEGVSQSLQMVNQVLYIETERHPNQNLLMPAETPDSMSIEQVRFTYPNTPIQKLNIPELHFKAGDRVLLLGPVGCGKTTLLKVLAGLYRPAEGRVKLGNADLWEMDPQIVTSQIGYLPQSPHLFKGTLRNNLALSGAVSDDRLIEIMGALGIDSIAAESPQGIDLEITEGGAGLSMGQRQLVALGRVMVGQPKIWLLDEPTASLDGDSEAVVAKALEQYVQKEDIVIIVTHRPMLMRSFANRAIVMQRGEIMKDASPDEVFANVARKPRHKAAHQPTRPKVNKHIDPMPV